MAGKLVREYSEEGGSRWYQGAVPLQEHEAEFAIQRTQREIAKSAWVSEEEFAADPGGAGADMVDQVEDNRDLMEQMEQTEGADGRPLPFEEIIHRNLYGDDPNGNDRPVELHNMEQAVEYIGQLEGELEQERELGTQLISGGLPTDSGRAYMARREQFAAGLRNAGMYDEQVINNIVDAAVASDINASLANAHRQFGDDYLQAEQQMAQLDRQNPRHMRTLLAIAQSPNPGLAMMQTFGQQRQAPRQQALPKSLSAGPQYGREPQQEPAQRELTQRQPDDLENGASRHYDRDQHNYIADIWEDRRRY